MAQDDFSTGTVELEEAEVKVDRPPLFTVVIFNDDFTPMEFVVYVIQKFLDTIMQNQQKSCSKYTIRAGDFVVHFPKK